MPLTPHTKLGPFEILSPLGAGGMGEVYRARDSMLGRDVAIKVLPEEFSQHPHKLARFEREAKLLATLNHPGIATLHGLEEIEGKPFLVMELVEGETLAERITRGPLPVDEALAISQQIAEALEAAHEKGVIHRDLKPANVKVEPEGHVKVLDFGLAKLAENESGSPDEAGSQSPTLSQDATRAGVILGTAAYMSPEQAKGKTVDKRTDIFSFGIVLYEMLTGRKAFSGGDVSDVLASIIKTEPDWSFLPSDLDPRIQNLLRRCLRKDRKNRLQAIGDVRVEIQDLRAEPTVAPEAFRARRPWLAWAAAGVFALAFFVSLWRLPQPEELPESSLRLSADFGAGDSQLYRGYGETVVLSPDGEMLAFVGRMPDGMTRLYIRSLHNLEATPLSGTDGVAHPFFSPDGRWLAFFSGGALKKVSVSGGAVMTMAEAPLGRGGAWGPDDSIVYSPTSRTGLRRVPASGGTPIELTALRPGETNHRWPWFLPNGKAVLFVVQPQGESFNDANLEAVLLETGERKVVHRGGTYPRYAPSGHLLYARETTLFAMPFDPNSIEPTGVPRPVIEGVGVSTVDGTALFALAGNGSVVYVPSSEPDAARRDQLVWVDRQGVEQPAAEVLQGYRDPRLSPDGQHLAVFFSDANGTDVWSLDLGRATWTRMTYGEGNNVRPLWSPDGERIIYSADSGEGVQDIFSRSRDGSGAAEHLTSGGYRIPTSISSDGKTIVFRQNSATTGYDIGMVRLEGEREPEMLLQTPFDEHTGKLSPDDRWLAYVSDESGREEIYVRTLVGAGGKWQISTEGGTEPLWSRDGRELFYRNGQKMMAVAISAEAELRAGKPTLLFEGRYRTGWSSGNPSTNYDVTPGGQRFVMVKQSEETGSDTFILAQNWFEELKRLVPASD